MSVTTPAWQQCVQQLLAAPVESAEHRLGETLATADDDRAWSLLIDIITEDPAETPEYRAAVLHYVGALLTHPEGTPEWTVGRTFALMTDRERSAYIQLLVTESPRESRVYEIGWDLLAIIQGYPEAEVAA